LKLWAALSISTRRSASDCDGLQKKVSIAADKFEAEASKPNAVTALRRLAESNKARAKRRKKKKP